MKFGVLTTLGSLLALSILGQCATTTSTFDFCQTSYGTKVVSPVPTTLETVTGTTTKTSTVTISTCFVTVPILPIPRVTTATYTTSIITITAPTQTRTATVTATAAQSTVSVTASATTTVAINAAPKDKRANEPALEHPHGVPAIERRAPGFPQKVYCFREIYIQTISTSTSCKSTKITSTPTTFTSTTTLTATSTSTDTPTTTITSTVTTTLLPITRTTTITITATSTPTQSSVCDVPPTIADTRSCPSVTASYSDHSDPDSPIDRTATFTQFYTGTGFYEDPLCSASLTGPYGACDYWYNMVTYDCSLTVCEAVQRCANDAIAFDYYSIDLHFRRSTNEWQCAYFKYDKEFSSGSTAADFNQADPDVVVAYGYQD